VAKQFELSSTEKRQLRNELYMRDGKQCHYCGIPEGDFYQIWGGPFYGGFKRGQRLEIDRKVNALGYDIENCVLACPICNVAKSDKFSYDEFKEVGQVISKIWRNRKKTRTRG
jgi:5-methylcytosine-specific restriction endonuclease McrA